MLLSDWYLARQEKQIQTAKAEGIAEGKAEGITEGKAEVYQEIAAWHARRTAAEARGETFTEPPPGVPKMALNRASNARESSTSTGGGSLLF